MSDDKPTAQGTPAPTSPGEAPPGAPQQATPTPTLPTAPVQPPPAAEQQTDWLSEYNKLKTSYEGLQGAQKGTEQARKKLQDELEALRGEQATALGKVTTLETQLAELTKAKEGFDGQLAEATTKLAAAAAENQKLTLILTKYPNLAPIASGIAALADAAQMEAQLKQMSEALAAATQSQVQAQVQGLVPGGSGPGNEKTPGDPGWEWVRDNLDSLDPDTAAKAQKWYETYVREGRHPALQS